MQVILLVEIESTLELIAQQQPPQGAVWLGMFFLTGFIVGLAATFIVAGLWSRDRRRIKEEAAAAGVSLYLESRSSSDVLGIEACGICIGSIIVIAAGALGISLPLILPEGGEFLIVMIIMIIFGSAFWGLAIGSIPYVRSYRRGFRKALQMAIDNKSKSQ
jgi:hypothetical protein